MPSYHDDAAGRLRGKNSIFVFELGALRLVHLGDLGHLLHEGEIERLVPVDLLFVPVGEHYTLGAQEAWQVINGLQPRVVHPHALSDGCNAKLASFRAGSLPGTGRKCARVR